LHELVAILDDAAVRRMRALRFASTLACLAALACATSRIETSWVEPGATARSFEMRCVLVVALAPDGAIRRAAEDALWAALASTPRGQSGQLSVEPSYRLLTDRDLSDVDAARKKVDAAAFDGAVLVRFVSAEQRISSHGTGYHPGFWGFYGSGASHGAYVRTDTILRLQVNIFSLAEDKLLWSGVSRTTNPRGVDELVREVADAVRDDLVKRELVPGSAG
jgi:hypothetical protein